MPSPVSFLLSVATFPANYSATPQQFAQDLVNRMTVVPSAPWNSFQVGALVPSSDMGPVLYDTGHGMQWLTFDRQGTGSYVNLIIDGGAATVANGGITNSGGSLLGGGLLVGSVAINALAPGAAGGILTYDASGNPTVTPPAAAVSGPNWNAGNTYQQGQYVTYSSNVYYCYNGPVTSSTNPASDTTHWQLQPSTTSGMVLTQSSTGLPTWMALPASAGASNFELTLSASQTGLTSSPSGTNNTLQFNTVKFINGCTTNGGSYGINIGASQTWFLYFQGQFEYNTGTPPTWQATVSIVNSVSGQAIGGVTNSVGNYSLIASQSGTTPFAVTYTNNSVTRQGVHASGIMYPVAASIVNVVVNLVETPGSSNISLSNNASTTRFGGYRIN